MFSKRTLGIIYIERTGFTYYTDTTPPVTFKYPPESVQELEVTNEELFIKEVMAFITANKLVAGNAVIIIGPELLYEREYIDEQTKPAPSPAQAKPENNQPPAEVDPTKPLSSEPMAQKAMYASHEERLREISHFVESVPFEDIASKIYKIDKGVRVVVTNKRLFQTIKTSFVRLGFMIDAVVPMSMLGKEFGIPTGMTDELVKKILIRIETVKENNIMQADASVLSTSAPQGRLQMSTKVQSKREFALIGVFVVLLVILGVVAYVNLVPDTKVASVSKQPRVGEIPPPPTNTPVASPSAALDKAAVRITISGGTPAQADALRQALITNGFTSIAIKSGPPSGKVFVVFSTTLSQEAREAILSEIRKSNPNVTVQENALTDADIVITL